ncbi:MAG TPA: hypothetical protein VKR82_00810 [Candidatus Acidoferrales bacterium]|nr:hypothetical protein [Candidatus Acidoferrales bacterium]
MILGSAPFYTHSFGAIGERLETARRTTFFQWFHFEQTEGKREDPGEAVRFRPSGDKFHDLCYLDVLVAPDGGVVQMELVVRRSFIDGPDQLFAQDLVKSFLLASLPDACQNILQDFIREISSLGRDGETPGYLVFLGTRKDWKAQTGWTNLILANLLLTETPSFVVHLSANPAAPNARRIE